MFHSASLALARLQMSRPKRNGPPEKPNPMDSNLSVIFDLVMHVNGRVDKLHSLMVNVALGLGLGLVGVLVTVLVK